MTAANKLASYGGTLEIESVDYEVEKWTAKINQELLEVTNMASGGWKEYITGLKSLEGSLEGKWDTTISGSGDFPAPFVSTPASFALTIGDKSLTFEGYIENFDLEADVQGAFSFSCDFKSTGVVTYVSS